MRPPFTLDLAFTSGLPHASGHSEVESAAKEKASLLMGSAGDKVLGTKRQSFQQRYVSALNRLQVKQVRFDIRRSCYCAFITPFRSIRGIGMMFPQGTSIHANILVFFGSACSEVVHGLQV